MKHLKQRRRIFIGRLWEYGVDDGNRTHDHRNHNPALYQLSYVHHIALAALLVSKPPVGTFTHFSEGR
ncbi:protein of unknown function [Pseudomonas sp. JV241A]|nr:protein of unknown function [Pseudomonas sp. JV241A]